MQFSFFEKQIERLKEVYGIKSFPVERTKLIWRSVKDLSDEWLEQTVDYFIAYESHAPMQDKWDSQISKAREENHRQEKYQHKKDADQFLETFSVDDKKTLIHEIKRIARRNMTEQEKNSFIKMITSREFECSKCKDEKVYNEIRDGIIYTMSCFCRFKKG